MDIAARLKIAPWDDGAVREALQDARGPFFVAAVSTTRLDDLATETFYAAPSDLALLGFAVAEALGAGGSIAAGAVNAAPGAGQTVARTVGATPSGTAGLSSEARDLAGRIAGALRAAQNPLVVSGASLGEPGIVHAAANIAWALHNIGKPAALSFALPESNTLGAGLMGGGDIAAAAGAVHDGAADTVIVLENDIYRRADKATIDRLLGAAKHLVVVEHLANDTSARAEIAFPAATFAESDGTLVSNEARAQRFYQVFVPAGDVQESWRWLRDLAIAAGRLASPGWRNLDEIDNALADDIPAFRPILDIAPPASFRIAGAKIARQPARYSGRTAMHANVDVSEPKPPDDPDAPFSFSMEGFQGQPPPALIPRFWAPGWNSIQALNKFQDEVAGSLRGGDPGKRLFETAQGEPPAFHKTNLDAFERRGGEFLVVPLYHIFGSEELSVLTTGVAELAPQPYLGLNPTDAAAVRLREGDSVVAPFEGMTLRLTVRLVPTLPPGVAGLPAGLPETKSIMLPAWSRLDINV
jgi:NADH-quinone oxidoreductase subunit G